MEEIPNNQAPQNLTPVQFDTPSGPRSQKKRSYTSVIVVVIVLLGLALLAYAYREQVKSYLGLNPQSTTVTPSSPSTSSSQPVENQVKIPSGIKLATLNHKATPNGGSPDYSFQYPDQNAVEDGLAASPPGYFSQGIKSHINSGGTLTVDDWVIQHLTIKDGGEVANGDFLVPNSDFFNTLSQLEVGKTLNISTSFGNHASYPFTRQLDIKVAGVTARVYTSTYASQEVGKQSKYAIFHNGSYTYMLAVEWGNSQNSYIFDLVTTSFRFSLRP